MKAAQNRLKSSKPRQLGLKAPAFTKLAVKAPPGGPLPAVKQPPPGVAMRPPPAHCPPPRPIDLPEEAEQLSFLPGNLLTPEAAQTAPASEPPAFMLEPPGLARGMDPMDDCAEVPEATSNRS